MLTTGHFRNTFGEKIFDRKYKNETGGCGTWPGLAETLVHNVAGNYLSKPEQVELIKFITEMKFIPAGRYLYYAGRPVKFMNNCFAFKAEDSREGWADLGKKHFLALMSGGGCGTYYGDIRPSGSLITKTGGTASGPISLMHAINEIGRNVMQGGSRRSALWAGLPWDHPDIDKFLTAKQYTTELKKLKETDFNFPAPLDMTNISVIYNKDWFNAIKIGSYDAGAVLRKHVIDACKDGEPGFSFDIHEDTHLRNACTEFISDKDSDVCNLGSVNMSRIDTLAEFQKVCYLGAKFLYCGSLESKLPLKESEKVRKEHRKIGLGLMGIHEWLLKKGYKYDMNTELKSWLSAYESTSKLGADEVATKTGNSPCIKYRAVAPAGTISILAGTTSGIEPLFSVATKRRYLDHKQEWAEEYYIDPTALELQKQGIALSNIETASALSKDVQRRLRFQAGVQKYVDMGISSTIQLPPWEEGHESYCMADDITQDLIRYASSLRGVTFYPANSRGGQPLTEVSIEEAASKIKMASLEAAEESANAGCKGGVCGI